MILVLGAGIAGLSASYHLGHERCLLLEKSARPFGHAGNVARDGFVWDTGPHVSFTKHAYVKALFEEGVDGAFEEFEVKVGNYYQGHWITHPAQTSLHEIPEPLRGDCLSSFLKTREQTAEPLPRNADYGAWLEAAFGPVFARNFPSAYTRKYWTREPSALTTDWIGERVAYPDVADVVAGSKAPLTRNMHYINKVRYPRSGGFESFAAPLRAGARIRFGAEVASIDLVRKLVWLSDGESLPYTRLVNTLPLPSFIGMCVGATDEVKQQARRLSCTQLLLVNVAAPHETQREEHWLYVYDEDKFTTRINFTERLNPGNAPSGWTGVQAEVYFSRHRPLPTAPDEIARRVELELVEMGLIEPALFRPGERSHRHVVHAPWANIVFDFETAPALESIWAWLAQFGLEREEDDVVPLTDWKLKESGSSAGTVAMAGRFGQWKYYWSDDCVLRGQFIASKFRTIT